MSWLIIILINLVLSFTITESRNHIQLKQVTFVEVNITQIDQSIWHACWGEGNRTTDSKEKRRWEQRVLPQTPLWITWFLFPRLWASQSLRVGLIQTHLKSLTSFKNVFSCNSWRIVSKDIEFMVDSNFHLTFEKGCATSFCLYYFK